jgi:hypothetical protein
LLLNKEYAAVEKRIKNDRDRKAFDEAVRNTFYSVWARSFFSARRTGMKVLLESARGCWEKGEGHPLLAETARHQWAGNDKEWKEFFGDRFYARSHPGSLAERIEYESVEQEWEREGRQSLPGYFQRFGVPSAAEHLREVLERVKKERREKEQRGLTPAETAAIAVLTDVLRSLSPTLASLIENRKIKYTVAETETLLGEFRQGRAYASTEVYLSAEVFVSDFARALAVFLHEHSHTFGYDGSRGFTDALTELLELVVRYRDLLGEAESKWHQAMNGVIEERMEADGDSAVDARDIDVLDATELRALLKALPESVQRELLRNHRMKP